MPTPNRSLPARLYLWLAERLYHEFAWAYDLVSWLVSLGRWNAWRAEVLEHLQGEHILEIGFGTGELLIELSRQGYSVIGLEPSPQMQRVTRCKLRRLKLEGLPRLRGKAQELPFAEQSFDAVIATFPAQYILEQPTFAEVWRVLRSPNPHLGQPPGRFVLVGVAAGSRVEAFLGRAGLTPPDSAGAPLPGSPWKITIAAPAGEAHRLPVFIFEKQANPNL